MDKYEAAFRLHGRNARNRGVEFLLVFEEWCSIWNKSGHWNERGCRRGQYVMSRFGDKGPYAVGNVRITTVTDNHKEFRHSLDEVDRIRQRMVGNQLGLGNQVNVGRKASLDTKVKMSVAHLGNQVMLGRKLTAKTKAKMKRSQLLRRKREREEKR